MTKEQVVLVDETDRELGTEEKLAAHARPRLHRAFSIYVFNGRGEVLLQRRARAKYHSGGLWSNTCCGHPRPGEEIAAAARRRLGEELGFQCRLWKAFRFIYRAELDAGLTEHELDHVFIGTYQGELRPDPAEVEATDWIEPGLLSAEIAAHPERYTVWMRISVDRAAAAFRAGPPEEQIWAAIQAANRAWVGGDPRGVATLYHPEVVGVAPDFGNRLLGREAMVQSFVDYGQAARTRSFQQLDHSVDVFDDQAVATYRFAVTYELAGKTYSDTGLEILLFVRRDDRWEAIWRAQVPVSPAPSPAS